MTKELRIQKIFQEVLDDDEFLLDVNLKREDVEGWDSLTHIQLVLALEIEFGIKFGTQQIVKIQSVKDILNFLEGV